METKIPHSILVHDLLAIEIKINSETANEFQCKMNHGPELGVEFSIPIQTAYKYLSNF